MSQTVGQALGASEPLAVGDAVQPQDAARTAGAQVRRAIDREAATKRLVRGDLGPFQRNFRHWFARTVSALVIRGWFRATVVRPDRFQDQPCVYAFNHLSWLDPLLILATFPTEPRLYFYGPKEENLRSGGRNRFLWWTSICLPFSPLKDDLRKSIRWTEAVFDTGGALVIAPEGTIHVHEGDLLPFEEGAAYLAIRSGVPIVPVALTGVSAAYFRGRVQVRLGEPIETAGVRVTRRNIARFSALTWHAIRQMVDDDRDLPRPGRFQAWLTDLFNDWGPGGRPAASLLKGPDPADVPIPPLEVR